MKSEVDIGLKLKTIKLKKVKDDSEGPKPQNYMSAKILKESEGRVEQTRVFENF